MENIGLSGWLAFGLMAIAVLVLYLHAKRRRQAAERLDRIERELPEFLRNPGAGGGRSDFPEPDLSLDIHPWGGRPRRPPQLDRR